MLKSTSTSTSMIVVGVLAIIAGIVALAWPGVTVLVLVILFAVYAFSAAITQGSRAFSSDGFGPVLGHLLLAVVDVAAGVAALAWPAPTVLVLVYVVGFWAILGGLAEFFTGFAAGETAGTRALFLLGGLVSVAFGVVVLGRDDLAQHAERWGYQRVRARWVGNTSRSNTPRVRASDTQVAPSGTTNVSNSGTMVGATCSEASRGLS